MLDAPIQIGANVFITAAIVLIAVVKAIVITDIYRTSKAKDRSGK